MSRTSRAGIADIGKRLVGKRLRGQQQRLRLRFAMALLPDPELLILDEPTTGIARSGSGGCRRARSAAGGYGRCLRAVSGACLMRPDREAALAAARALPDLPIGDDGPVFREPWEAHAFAMAVTEV